MCVFEIPTDAFLGGKLSLVEQTGNEPWKVDPIEISPNDQWAMPGGGGTSLFIDQSGVQLVYRRHRPDIGQYIFDLVLATRTTDGKWSFERVVKNINCGQNVIPFREGVTDVPPVNMIVSMRCSC